ncbi:ArsR/SmtB family transcription factor [Brevibacterium picturae]|uniref:Winged helix-turn-helix domain-containing protein n=1 Tax=Brevibacterium picturae TaxID=260553 RepID=A0ABN2CBD9_9MICO
MAADDLEPTRSSMDLGVVLAAVADPLRRQVVHELVLSEDGVERTCASFGLPVSKSTRSHHFRVLREAGLVKQVDHGNFSGVTLRRADIHSRFPGLLELISADLPTE